MLQRVTPFSCVCRTVAVVFAVNSAQFSTLNRHIPCLAPGISCGVSDQARYPIQHSHTLCDFNTQFAKK